MNSTAPSLIILTVAALLPPGSAAVPSRSPARSGVHTASVSTARSSGARTTPAQATRPPDAESTPMPAPPPWSAQPAPMPATRRLDAQITPVAAPDSPVARAVPVQAAPFPNTGSSSPQTPSATAPPSAGGREASARGPSPGASAPAEGRYVWPLSGTFPPIVRRFDPPPQRWLSGHRGVDLGALPGTVVRSAGAGRVIFAGQVAGKGVVSVEHPGGLRTTYQPLHIAIAPGRLVTAGTPLGALTTGHPGCPVAACLHWGLRRGADYLDPLTLLALGRVRLLPRRPSP
ncbi:M23 family metallopeptidase [Catenuloplanes indicus]|nr:M23 family metallopeptidase [Catenuloplanes indicus]